MSRLVVCTLFVVALVAPLVTAADLPLEEAPTIWRSDNDGAASGLDADFLDGLSSVHFEELVAAEAAARHEAIASLLSTDLPALGAALSAEASTREAADLAESAARISADAQEAGTREAADLAESAARSSADAQEASTREAADLAESAARSAADTQEANARGAADASETAARIAAVSGEAAVRASADSSLWGAVTGLQGYVRNGSYAGSGVELTKAGPAEIRYRDTSAAQDWKSGANPNGFYVFDVSAGAYAMTLTKNTGDATFRGHIYAHTNTHVGDIAEPVAGAGLLPGDVVVADGFTPEGKLRVARADQAISRSVVGIISTNPSLTLAGLPTDTPLAVSGIVPVRVTGPIAVGDMLVSSAEPGRAQTCAAANGCVGAVVAKALEADDDGDGIVRALVMLG